VSLGCVGCEGDGRSEPGLRPDVCDGSEDIRLYVGEWAGGAANAVVDYVMYADGMRFLMVDGRCRFYVYDGEAAELRWWEPVRTGNLGDDELEDALQRLDVGGWSTLIPASNGEPSGHLEWDRFSVVGEYYECPVGCSAGSEATSVLSEARVLIGDLVSRSDAYVASSVEVSVVPEPAPAPSRLPVTMVWGASQPVSVFLDDVTDVLLSSDAKDIGTMVIVEEEPWFTAARKLYLETVPIGLPSEIGILDASGEVAFDLYVRPAVPEWAWRGSEIVVD